LFPVKNDNDIINQKEYASIIGSLRYATDCTRPDIAYAVGVLSRFTSKPTDCTRPDIAYAVGVLIRFTSKPSRDHWHAIERVMKYLSGTKTYGLFIKSILLCLKVLVMPIGTLCQVILSLPLVLFLL
jgi:hypothetical protein